MPLPDPGEWRRISPFAIVFFFASTIRTIIGNGVNLATSFGIVALLSSLDFLSSGPLWALAVLLALAGIGIRALVRYWFIRFRIEEDRVLLRQGFLKRTALDLPFDRIQAIHVERSLMYRLLGLVTVRIETSGSAAAEGLLPTISGELADWLRDRVERERVINPVAAPVNLASPVPADSEASSPHTLLRLKNADMVRIGLADYRIFLFAAALGGVTSESWWNGVSDSVASMLADRSLQLLVAAAIGLVFLIAIAFTLAALASAFLRHHDFTLWRKGTVLRSCGGLLTQKEVVVEVARVQCLSLSQNLVMRWFRRFKLSALTAGADPATDDNARSQSELSANLQVPLLDGAMAESLRREVFGDEAKELSLRPTNPEFVRVSPWYIRAVALRIALIPLALAAFVFVFVALIETVVWYIDHGSFGREFPSGPMAVTALFAWGQLLVMAVLAWVLISILIAWQLWRRRAVLCVDEGLAACRGLLGYRVDAFLFRKVQSVKEKQSPLQRRRRLATLEIQLASGEVTIPYIDHSIACRLRDYILWTVESDRLRWY